jgi:predicted nucleic acid-binding protein
LYTNIFSEARKGARAGQGVREWLFSLKARGPYVSALVVGEMRQGMERLRRRDSAQAGNFAAWHGRLLRNYADHIVSVAAEVAEERRGVPDPPSTVDGLMVATAKTRGTSLATRNTDDTVRTGVRSLNLFAPSR